MVYIQPMFAMASTQLELWAKHSLDEISKFKQYYKAPLQLLKGFKFIKNTECKLFLAELSETNVDLIHIQPVKANLPYAYMLVGQGALYKVLALLDLGSTNTLASLALLEQMPQIKATK